MKRMFIFLGIIFILIGVYLNKNEIAIFISDNLAKNEGISEFKPNEYYKPVNYEYVQITDDFIAKDKKHLLNIYYTVINSGASSFEFKCSKEYEKCLDDVNSLSRDQITLSNINSFVSPFNSFESIETNFDSLGHIEIIPKKHYTDKDILEINNKMDEISRMLSNTTNQREMIKKVHDYVINTSKYDKDRSDKGITKYKSNIAYGPLFQGYALCGGYSDAMALFLDRYDIPNFKVISENHVWNAVKLENKWLHLDLTWDDPVSKDGKDNLEYTFFLINNKELTSLNTNQHIFDKTVFSEIANN